MNGVNLQENRVIPDPCDVWILRNEEEHRTFGPNKTPQKTPQTGDVAFPPVVFDGGFAGWWKRRSISTKNLSNEIPEKMELFPCLFLLFVDQTSFWKTTFSRYLIYQTHPVFLLDEFLLDLIAKKSWNPWNSHHFLASRRKGGFSSRTWLLC